jgi:protein-tyrosine phosphatase
MSFARNHPADQIPDPYNGGADVFELVLDLIEDAAAGLVESLASGQLSKAALRNLPVAQ